MRPIVLHVLPALTGGGPGRALLTLASAVPAFEHRVAVLRPVADPQREWLSDHGLLLLADPSPAAMRTAIGAADIVQLHFWNSPELYEALRRPWPDARLLTWCHVHGGTAPQVLSAAVCRFSDSVVAATPLTTALPHLGDFGPSRVIPQTADAGRVAAAVPRPHDGFVVGYVGTVDPAKMHPRFVALSSRVEVDGARFVVCGSGGGFPALAREAEALGTSDRFEFIGYRTDVGAVLAGCDVFGYPLGADNYSSGELALQEAMHAGIPPVVLPHGGAGAQVEHGVTGLVAPDENGYVAALERLGADPELRRLLGAQARAHARRTWTVAGTAAAWRAAYDDLLEAPKRPRCWSGGIPATGAEAFLAGLADREEPFRASLDAAGPSAAAADDAVLDVPPAVVSADGGVLDYRRMFPGDPHLRLWSGLVLAARGQIVFAAGELTAAVRLGIDPGRVAPRLRALGVTPVEPVHR